MYNAVVESHPEEEITVTKAMDSNFYRGGIGISNEGMGYYSSGSAEIAIPENYQADSAIASVNYTFHRGGTEFNSVSIQIAGQSYDHILAYPYQFHDQDNIPFDGLNGVTDTLEVSYESYDTGTLAISVAVSCSLTNSAKAQWQNETYNAIVEAYNERMNEYNDFMRAEAELSEAAGEDAAPKFNPGINRAMERRELKRCAIELLTKGTDIKLAKNRYIMNSENLPVINADDQLEKDTATIKFFEQAFDWEIMSYNLYPYYYNKPSAWKDLIKNNQDGADPIFDAFLRSGMARLVVPVRPGFETAVGWYESTGEIWEGQGMVTDINDGLYLSVAEELTDPAGEPVGQPWETKVPTSLTIVQEKSAYLPDGGLPCDPNCDIPSQFGETSLVISGGSASNASDGVGADIVGTDNNVA